MIQASHASCLRNSSHVSRGGPTSRARSWQRAAGPQHSALPQQDPNAKSIFVFGLNGYCALGLCNVLAAKGWSIAGTVRSQATATLLASRKGWLVHVFDPALGAAMSPSSAMLLSPDGVADLTSCTHMLSGIPPLGLPLYDPVLQAQLDLLPLLAATAASGAAEGCGSGGDGAAAGGAAAGGDATAGTSSGNASASATASARCWLGYLSSTGVYGDWGGDWVDEDSEPRPGATRGLIRLEAERAWGAAAAAAGLGLTVLRLGGIYGPGRSAMEAAAAAAAAAADPSAPSAASSASKKRRERQRFTARVHVLDICSAVEASMASAPPCDDPMTPRVFNVVDDEPAPRGEVVSFAASLMGVRAGGAPQQGQQQEQQQPSGSSAAAAAAEGGADGGSGGGEGSAGRRRRGGEATEEKRVRNARLKDELHVVLTYPTYREGLAALHAGCIAPFEEGDLEVLLRAGKEVQE